MSPRRQVRGCALGRKSKTLETSQEAVGLPAAGEPRQPCGPLQRGSDVAPSPSPGSWSVDSRRTVLHPWVNADHDLLFSTEPKCHRGATL